jgi:hypothetical protein
MSIEIKFFKTAGYTFIYHKMNGEILEEMKVKPVKVKLRRYKSNCLRHVTRMNNNKTPKTIPNYGPN